MSAMSKPVFLKALAALEDHPLVGEAKGVGLIAGVELVADKQTKRAFDPSKSVVQMLAVMAEQEGLIVRASAGRPFRAVPAAGDHGRGNRRTVHPPGQGAGQHAGLGDPRKKALLLNGRTARARMRPFNQSAPPAPEENAPRCR